MKKINKILVLTIITLLSFSMNIYAHGGNITGWNDKNSAKITEYNGKYYGYHNEEGVCHYHQVEWDEAKQKWKIVNSAVYYDENFNVINALEQEEIERIKVKFNRKIDGDTAEFELNNEIIKVRFLGINTPETVDKNRGEEPYGKEASAYTEEKLKNATKIELEYDSNASEKDKYGRILAWVFVDDSLLQKELVSNGLAETYMLENNYRYAGVLQLAEEEAKNNKLGIWSSIEQNSDTENVNNNEIQITIDRNVLLIVIALILVILIGITCLKKNRAKKD